MGLKGYLPAAVATFFAGTTGADLYARTAIGQQAFSNALHEHLYWAGVQAIGTLLLLAPFVVVALVCTRSEKQTRTRSVALIFAVAMLTLLYSYVEGHLAAQRAMMAKMWTAATLSIGLLPFFIGVPVVLGVIAALALAARVDRRRAD